MFNPDKSGCGNSSLRNLKIINRSIVNINLADWEKTGIKVITCCFQKELNKVKKKELN
jgi:hypothetical protein